MEETKYNDTKNAKMCVLPFNASTEHGAPCSNACKIVAFNGSRHSSVKPSCKVSSKYCTRITII